MIASRAESVAVSAGAEGSPTWRGEDRPARSGMLGGDVEIAWTFGGAFADTTREQGVQQTLHFDYILWLTKAR
jgi:hypothetical protein